MCEKCTKSGTLVHVGTHMMLAPKFGPYSKAAQNNIDLAFIRQETLWKAWQSRSSAEYDALPEPKAEYEEWTAPGRRRVLLRRARIVLRTLKSEYLGADWDNRRVYQALKQDVEAIVYSLELSHLDRDVLEGEFALPLLLLQNTAAEKDEDNENNEHAARVIKVEAEAQRSHRTAWDVVGLSRTTYFLWKGRKPALPTEKKTSTDLIADKLT